MSLVYMNIMMAFTVSLAGLLMYRSHLVSSLLCLAMVSNTYGTDYVQNLNLLQC